MRERIFTDTGTAWVHDYLWKEGSNVIDSHTITGTQSRLYAAMRDIVTPGFKVRQAKGEVIQNPLWSQHFSLIHQPCVYTSSGRYQLKASNPLITHANARFVSVPGSPLTWLDIEEYLDDFANGREIAVSRAWSNCDISEMQALASLGEAPETIKWIGGLLQRMINLLRLFSKKGLKKQLKKLVRDARSGGMRPKNLVSTMLSSGSDFWLELRYAVRPLIFEMYQAVAALNKSIDKAIRYTARGKEEEVAGSASSVNVSQRPDLWTDETKESTARVSTYRAGVLYRLKSNLKEKLSIWGGDQGFETVWELTPFSFIIDWFFNVGDVIGAWAISTGIEPLTSWVTEKHVIKKVFTHKFEILKLDPEWTYHFSESGPNFSQLGKAEVSWTFKRRTPCPERYNLPHCTVNLDWAKLIDLAAIGRGILNGLVFSKRKAA